MGGGTVSIYKYSILEEVKTIFKKHTNEAPTLCCNNTQCYLSLTKLISTYTNSRKNDFIQILPFSTLDTCVMTTEEL